jgi:hypothetical protein
MGLLPPVIAHNYEREEMVDRQMRSALALYGALQALDPRLDLVFVTDRADPEYGVKPGRWHVVRKNDPPAPDSYIAIETPEGGYREPDSGVLEELRRRDLWRGMPDMDNAPSMYRESDPLRKEQERDDDHVADVRAALRVAGDGGMTKRTWGRLSAALPGSTRTTRFRDSRTVSGVPGIAIDAEETWGNDTITEPNRVLPEPIWGLALLGATVTKVLARRRLNGGAQRFELRAEAKPDARPGDWP